MPLAPSEVEADTKYRVARFEILHGGDTRGHSRAPREAKGRPARLEAPSAEEVERGAVGVDCVLLSARRYLVGLAGEPRGADLAACEGALIRLRLVFADNGEPVLPAPLVGFARGAKVGEARTELVLRMNGKGYSAQRFGIAASSFLHRRRAFRLLIEDMAGRLLDSLLAAKRARVGGGGAGRRPSSAASLTASGTSGASSDSEREAGPEAGYGSEYGEEKKGGGGDEEEQLALQFQRAVHLYPDADAAPEEAPLGPLPAPPPPPPLPAHAIIPAATRGVTTEGAGLPTSSAGRAAPHTRGPPPASFSSPLSLTGMPPPYRHAGGASREGALAMVYASHAAVGAVAASVGVKHPVALSNAEVFDSPLFRSREGRFRARRALEDLRLAGSPDLVEAVAGAWRALLLAAGCEAGAFVGLPDADEAALAAEHAWNAVAVLCGEVRPHRLGRPLPVPRDYVFALVDHAERLVAPHFAGRPVLRCEAMRRRAWALEQWRESEGALELYFGAWSELIRAGETPCRQEAALLCELADSLLRMPHRSHMGFHICTRLYWFCEGDEEDRFGEACAVRTLGWEAFMRGQWRNSRRHLERAVDILAPMSPGYRAPLERIFQTMSICSFHTADLGGLRHYAGRSLEQACEAYGFAYPELDYTFNWLPWWVSIIEHKVKPGTMKREPRLEDLVSNMRWSLLLMDRFAMRTHPLREAVVGHALFQLARTHMHCGEWSKALASLARARSVLYDRYPAYFPHEGGRMESVRRMEAECRAGMAAAAVGAGPAPPAPRRAPPSPPS
eukprot:tig00001373_g8448.t1